ncbi:hypothetical protein BSKO_01121 [Bryopsis sp. KO-2023]|nr:hypothetical protein BSKO_01121 [Bryopsis sp. KO-2023]
MGCASSSPVSEDGTRDVVNARRALAVLTPSRERLFAPCKVSCKCLALHSTRFTFKSRRRSSCAERPCGKFPSEGISQQPASTKCGFSKHELPRLTSTESQSSDKNSDQAESPEIGTAVGQVAQLDDEQLDSTELDHDADVAHEKSRGKERRLGYGVEVVREQIRRMAVGGPQTEADKANLYEVSSSEDSEVGAEYRKALATRSVVPSGPWEKPEGVTEAICDSLAKNIVFRGINQGLLQQVVDRMYGVSFQKGAIIVQQGEIAEDDSDCMFYLEKGEVDIVISGNAESRDNNETRKVEGNVVVIHKEPGWVFGDVALLFNTPRTASIVSSTRCTLWAMERKTFLRFVMRHAPGARALRFVRKLPLLKGLSDNALLSVAERLEEKTYQDGEALIQYGERGDQLYLIRYGKVRVLRPGDNGGEKIEVACIGRGQFVGERTLVTGKLRSADCVASGEVQVVVINKKDFWDMDNPLLAWMLDYDAVTCALKSLPQLKMLTQPQLEQIIDRFDSREEIHEGDVILREGQPIDKLYVIKNGDLEVHRAGDSVANFNFIREAGGFSYFGAEVLDGIRPSPVTVTVKSESSQILTLRRSQLDDYLGPAQGATVSVQPRDVPAIVSMLGKVSMLERLKSDQLGAVARSVEMREFHEGDVVAWSGEPAEEMFVIKSGQCVVTTALGSREMIATGGRVQLMDISKHAKGELKGGDAYGEDALLDDSTDWGDTVIASFPRTQVLMLKKKAVENALGSTLNEILKEKERTETLSGVVNSRRLMSDIRFEDLEQHRIVGTGQFGLVRLVRHIHTGSVYALKVMHKGPITESKQVEHVVNERQILEEANHPFCVRIVSAFQDEASLYLLQEWVPGGELFHHLDLEGSFDEATAMFYAATVLLSLEFLHSKGIVYRDLKPENLLLDVQGYIKVADFGFAKKIGKERTYTICGTPDYQAPEVIMRRGTTKAADYWALGVLIFEMLVGDPPFKSVSGDPWDTFRRTLSGRFYVPNFISAEAADLIYKLLQVNPERRLGSGRNGADDIKHHRWFSRMDWTALREKRLPAPKRPRVKNPLDTSNFDVFDGVETMPNTQNSRIDREQWGDSLWEWIDTAAP